MMLLPADQGIRVRPPGQLLSDRERLNGSFKVEGVLTLTRAQGIKLLIATCQASWLEPH